MSQCDIIWQFPNWPILLVVSAQMICGGCRDSSSYTATNHPGRRLLVFGRLYTDYETENRGRRPADAQTLKNFINGLGAERLEELGINDVDELFVSERDGQPLVVFYGNQGRERTLSAIVAYEQAGQNGMRQIVYRQGVVREVDENDFREVVGPLADKGDENRR